MNVTTTQVSTGNTRPLFGAAGDLSRLPFRNPFVGLRPFEPHERPLFFGRDQQTAELLQQLHRTRLLAVVGSSGCGKSSLIRAGLIPKLKAGFLVEDRDVWLTVTMKPGTDPIGNLAEALIQEIPAQQKTVEEIASQIRSGGTQTILEQVKSALTESDANLLLLVDQFEELFSAGDEAADFISILLALAEQKALPIYVVLTMRSDFWDRCEEFYGLPEAMNRSLYMVPRLTRQQRQQAIQGPIRLFGAGLTARLLDRVLNDAGDQSDQLPVMQHALMRTWEEWEKEEQRAGEVEAQENSKSEIRNQRLLDVQHYAAVGTIKDALSRDANSAIERMSAEDVKATERMFLALIEIGENNFPTRRPATLEKLCAITGTEKDTVLRLVKIFNDNQRSFLTLSGNKENPLIEISHESLIRLWKTLGEWVSNEVESLRTYLRLATAANRKEQTSATLYKGEDLYEAIIWKKERKPNLDWAANYDHKFGFDYNNAISFLEESTSIAKSKIEEQRVKVRGGFSGPIWLKILITLFTNVILLAWMLTAYSRAEDPNLINDTIPSDEQMWQWALRVSTSMIYFMLRDIVNLVMDILTKWQELSPERRFGSMLVFMLLVTNLAYFLKRRRKNEVKMLAFDEKLLAELSKLKLD